MEPADTKQVPEVGNFQVVLWSFPLSFFFFLTSFFKLISLFDTRRLEGDRGDNNSRGEGLRKDK